MQVHESYSYKGTVYIASSATYTRAPNCLQFPYFETHVLTYSRYTYVHKCTGSACSIITQQLPRITNVPIGNVLVWRPSVKEGNDNQLVLKLIYQVS